MNINANNMFKKIISFVLCFILIIPNIIFYSAAEGSILTTGKCGDNLTYSFDGSTGTLTISGTGAMYSYKWKEQFSFGDRIKVVKILDGVTNVGEYAFYNCMNLTSIVLPNSIISIGEYAFNLCDKLQSIKIPNNVISIGEAAFQFCINLTNIKIPNNVTVIDDWVFYGCEKLTDIELSNKITEIGNWSFGYCINMPSIVLPNCVKKIGNYAFAWCEQLTDITIPNDVTYIGAGTFRQCKNLSMVEIPSGVQNIYEDTFCLCDNLKNVKLSDGIKSIGSNAFSECTNLTSVIIPNGVSNIGFRAFNGCSKLLNIEIPDSVSSIGSYAFSQCKKLISVRIPNGVTNINFATFLDCEGLQNVEISNSVVEISQSAFQKCNGLKSVVIPENVKKIDLAAFENCTRLTDIEIPKSVTHIGWSAFGGCDSLNIVNYCGTEAEWKKIIIDECNEPLNRALINCNYSSIQNFESGICGDNANYLFNTETNVLIISGSGEIKDYQEKESPFFGDARIKKVIIQDGIQCIGKNVFRNCVNLININIPSSIEKIAANAFEDTALLKINDEGTQSVNGISIDDFCESLNLYNNKSAYLLNCHCKNDIFDNILNEDMILSLKWSKTAFSFLNYNILDFMKLNGPLKINNIYGEVFGKGNVNAGDSLSKSLIDAKVCFGISSAVMLLCNGDVKGSSVLWKYNNSDDIKLDKKDWYLDDLIAFMHVTQYSTESKVKSLLNAGTTNDETESGLSIIEDELNKGNLVRFNVRTSLLSHSVVGYRIEKTTNATVGTEYKIYVYDCECMPSEGTPYILLRRNGNTWSWEYYLNRNSKPYASSKGSNGRIGYQTYDDILKLYKGIGNLSYTDKNNPNQHMLITNSSRFVIQDSDTGEEVAKVSNGVLEYSKNEDQTEEDILVQRFFEGNSNSEENKEEWYTFYFNKSDLNNYSFKDFSGVKDLKIELYNNYTGRSFNSQIDKGGIIQLDLSDNNVFESIVDSKPIKIKNMEKITLSVSPVSIPDGAKIIWQADNDAVKIEPDGWNCTVTAQKNGQATVTMTIVDENGEVLKGDDGQELVKKQVIETKCSLIVRIIIWIKTLFSQIFKLI